MNIQRNYKFKTLQNVHGAGGMIFVLDLVTERDAIFVVNVAKRCAFNLNSAFVKTVVTEVT